MKKALSVYDLKLKGFLRLQVFTYLPRLAVLYLLVFLVSSPIQAVQAKQVYVYGPTPKVLKKKLTQSSIHWQQLNDATLKNFKTERNKAVLVLLGPQAALQASRLGLKADINLLAYVTQSSYRRLSSQLLIKPDAVLYRNTPYLRQLMLLQLLLPQSKRIGILCSEYSCDDLSDSKAYAKTHQLDLIIKKTNPKNLNNQLNALLNQTDSLLAIEDNSIYNPNTIGNILLNSYRRNKPIIGLRPSYVKAGVIASSFSTSEQYQQRLLDVIKQLIKDRNKHTKGFNSQYFNSSFELKINHHVARSMDLLLANSIAIRPLLKRNWGKHEDR